MACTRANTLLRQLCHPARDVRGGMGVEGDIVIPMRTKVRAHIWGMGSPPLALPHDTQVLMNQFVVEKNGLFHVSWVDGKLHLHPVLDNPFTQDVVAAVEYASSKEPPRPTEVQVGWNSDKHAATIKVYVSHEIRKLALGSEYGDVLIENPVWCFGGMTQQHSYATVEVPWWWWTRRTAPKRAEMYYYENICVV